MVGKQFVATYPLDGAVTPGPDGPKVGDWLAAWGGRSFGGGVYRLLRQEQVAWADDHIAFAFPGLKERASCFGYDWRGRLFATDTSRIVDGEAQVLLIDIGSGDAFDVPVRFSEFHDVECVVHGPNALASELFVQRREEGELAPGLSECVGYRVPPFLGGSEELDNLEITDLDVYLSLSGQLWAQVRHLPPGTPISDISIS